MKALVVAVVALGLGAMWIGRGLAADRGQAAASTEELVASLSRIDAPAPGLAGTAVYSVFIAEDGDPEFQTGILGSPAPVVPAQMRELVRRGLSALPILIQHLDDAHFTNLTIDDDRLMWRQFDDEYDPRIRSSRPPCDAACFRRKFGETRSFGGAHRVRIFKRAYRVRIGDVCFVLIGLIVNRNLTAVRYQPTGGLVVDSPIETPALGERVRMDWTNLDARSHQASLLGDIEAGNGYFAPSALRRLRFYYPDAYAALGGEAARKRAAFEAAEKKRRAAQ
jgi:hypothetical protein